jgi:hypothetical protein
VLLCVDVVAAVKEEPFLRATVDGFDISPALLFIGFETGAVLLPPFLASNFLPLKRPPFPPFFVSFTTVSPDEDSVARRAPVRAIESSSSLFSVNFDFALMRLNILGLCFVVGVEVIYKCRTLNEGV